MPKVFQKSLLSEVVTGKFTSRMKARGLIGIEISIFYFFLNYRVLELKNKLEVFELELYSSSLSTRHSLSHNGGLSWEIIWILNPKPPSFPLFEHSDGTWLFARTINFISGLTILLAAVPNVLRLIETV